MGPLDGFGNAAVYAFLMLLDACFTNFGAVDCLLHTVSACVAVYMPWPGLPVRHHMFALLASFGVAMFLKITLG